ncbi:hypothetical protein CASFOL_037127 [Castilleja foliolosa]|uniref:Retrotransposon Copia-like N-terminal domain-containing protein n=1 Tax=Castilleja foliolosa TaxID=1961234 RepID=A0ABD3BNP4_9LAMI
MSSDDDTKKFGELETTENKDLKLRIAEILRKENHGFARTPQFMQAPNIEPKLNEKNYFIWARKVKIVLGGRGRWHHITGVPEPPKINEPDYYIWEQNDLQILSWIIDSMDSDLSGQFLEYPTARELWEGILQTYRSGEDAQQIYDLNIQANRRDPNDMEMPNDILKFNKRMKTFRLYQFLHGADLKFVSVKRDLLKETPLSTVETVYSTLRREAARAITVNRPANEIGSGYASRNQIPKTETKSKIFDKTIDAGEELGFAATIAVKTEPPNDAANRRAIQPPNPPPCPVNERRQKLRRVRRHGRAGAHASNPPSSTNGCLGKRSSMTRSKEKMTSDGTMDLEGDAKKMTDDGGDAKKMMTSSLRSMTSSGPISANRPTAGTNSGLGLPIGPGLEAGIINDGSSGDVGPIPFGSIGETNGELLQDPGPIEGLDDKEDNWTWH